MLMGTFEPTLIWDWIREQLANENVAKPPSDNHKIFLPSPPPSFEEILSLTDFLLEVVSTVSTECFYLDCTGSKLSYQLHV